MSNDELVQAVRLALIGEVVKRYEHGCRMNQCSQFDDDKSVCYTQQVKVYLQESYVAVECPLGLKVLPDE